MKATYQLNQEKLEYNFQVSLQTSGGFYQWPYYRSCIILIFLKNRTSSVRLSNNDYCMLFSCTHTHRCCESEMRKIQSPSHNRNERLRGMYMSNSLRKTVCGVYLPVSNHHTLGNRRSRVALAVSSLADIHNCRRRWRVQVCRGRTVSWLYAPTSFRIQNFYRIE